MTWMSILKISEENYKYNLRIQNRGIAYKVERFAEGLANLLGKNISKVTYTLGYYAPKHLDLNNPNDLIFLAKTGVTMDGIDLEKIGKDNGFDLTAPKNLKLFMATMKKRGYDMKMFDVKGLLTQGSSSGSPSQLDYTTNIKDAIQMLTRMNKPVNKESVMYEADMEESEWNDKYNKLIQEKLQ